MRKLLPFDPAELGALEIAWLVALLALLGSCAPAGPRRRVWTLAVVMSAALAGLALPAQAGALWQRCLALPVVVSAAILAGWLPPARGVRLALGGLSIAPLLVGRGPFAIHLPEDWREVALLAAVWLGAFAATPVGRRWFVARRAGTRVALGAAVGFVAFGAAAKPFGMGAIGCTAVAGFFLLLFALLAQGPEMRRYVARRLVGMPFVLFLLLTVSFFLIRAAPGGPFSRERRTAPEIEAEMNRYYGFDRPLLVQYGAFMRSVFVEGDFGPSTKQLGRSVNEIIARHLGPSVHLGLVSFALALLIGVTAGIVAGIRRNSIFDYVSMTGAMLGLALPTFVVGPLLVLVFAMKLGWFRVAGWERFPADVVLPAITLSLPFAARAARLTRAGMLEVVHQDYVRTARAKGLPESTIVVRHILKGALLPVVSFLGPAFATILTGSLVVETVFGVPGLGREFVQSALNRDYGMTLGLVLVFGFFIVFFNMVVDVLYGFLDPRIRHG